MGESVTIGDSLIITVFSMTVVFIVLYLISLLIRVLKVTSNGKKEDKGTNTSNIIETDTVEEIDETDEGELIAAIAAAIAASLDVSIPQIRIREIRRISQNTPVWADMGRREQMKGIQ